MLILSAFDDLSRCRCVFVKSRDNRLGYMVTVLQVISSTSMAAREFDDVAESEEENPEAANGSPLISLPPPPPFRDAHVQVSTSRFSKTYVGKLNLPKSKYSEMMILTNLVCFVFRETRMM